MDFQRGLWYDYSRPTGLQGTITLPKDHANIFLSFLTLMVTIASAGAWTIVSLLLHSYLARSRRQADVFDIQQQVSLRNAKSPVATIVDAVKLHIAWSGKNSQKLLLRTATLVVPTLLLWASLTIATIFTSRVATRDASVIAPAKAKVCGLLLLTDINKVSDQQQEEYDKINNDTISARHYAINFYGDSTTASSLQSVFVVDALPYTVDTNAACPFANQSRCLEEASPIRLESGLLNSHDMFGINAKPADQVSVRASTECSLVDRTGLTENNGSYSVFYNFGPRYNLTNYTYNYPMSRRYDRIGYQIETIGALEKPALGSWVPLPDFARNDSDPSIIIMSQNAIRYQEEVDDPFFKATGNNSGIFVPNHFAQPMICYDQYMLCNPVTNKCTPWATYSDFSISANTYSTLGFSKSQTATAARLAHQMQQSNSYMSVQTMNTAALFASIHVLGSTSTGLPSNQWQIEVTGWFQTKLAKMQASVAEYINGPDESSILLVASPYDSDISDDADLTKTLQHQCKSQLVRSTGQIQNFSLAGVLIIIILSSAFVLIGMFMVEIMDYFGKLGHGTAAIHARQADEKLQLLRLALHSQDTPWGWELGTSSVPVVSKSHSVKRPARDDGFTWYHMNSSSDDRESGLIAKESN